MAKLPGRTWRFQAWGVQGKDRDPPIRYASTDHDGATEFDELVVGDWLHLEQLDHRVWWCRLGPVSMSVRVNVDGTCDLTVEDDGVEVLAYRGGRRVGG